MLTLVILLPSLLALGLGFAGVRFRWPGLPVLCLLAVLGWGARVAVILSGDAAIAEDYMNGLTPPAGAAELLVALLWLTLCYGGGRAGAVLRNARHERKK